MYLYNGLGGNPDDGRVQIGLIAQDVEKAAPELVGMQNVRLHPGDAKTTRIKTVDYGAISYLLVNAVKELKHLIGGVIEDVKKLARRVEEAFTRLAAHDDRFKELEGENKAMRDALCKLDGSTAFCRVAIPRKTSL